MAELIIGRAVEQKRLLKIQNSSEAELVAVYGRRRVGKTYLVRQFFAEQLFFEVTGEKGQRKSVQIARFCHEVSRVFFDGRPLPLCADWNAAFELLATSAAHFAAQFPDKAIIVFLDELPWLASHRSGLLPALDHAWNAKLSRIPSLRVILCGSAASWMLDKLVHAKGGLYNRITQRMELRPFSLAETSAYLLSRCIKLPQKQIAEIYMAIGGIPHYLKQVPRARSATQVIGELCFDPNGPLCDEFEHLFESLFDSSDAHRAIVRALAAKPSGISQTELVQASGLSGGGRFNKYLRELESSGFIATYTPFAKKKKDTLYRLVDEYSYFYLRWMESLPSRSLRISGTDHWHNQTQTPAYRAWSGYAFENLCFKHLGNILRALGLTAVGVRASSWRYAAPRRKPRVGGPSGAQID
ncbi:MAG: AAA family ATPase, partial [Kofleriaceae bacterium]|nr:AAA family ATPase [Kofleriaceae bacterium]